MKNVFGDRGGIGGGGGRGGGGMLKSLRTVGKRVSRTKLGGVHANPQDPFSSSASSSMLTQKHKHVSSNHPSSPSSTLLYTRKPRMWGSSSEGDDSEWVCVEEAENVLGRPPSEKEVDDAVSTLQRVLGPASGDQLTDTDWVEPSLSSYSSTALQANGFDRVYCAFHLLKTDPHVQRMVKSLSVDKIVWDAVLKNEVVRELREAIAAGADHDSGSINGTSDCDSSATTNVLMTIFDTTKAIFIKVIEKITKIVNELFHLAYHRTHANGEALDSFSDKLRTSFILSIMVMMLVVLNRAQARA